MQGSQHLLNDAKEVAIPLLVSFEANEQVTAERVYPPSSVDWELVGVRYEVVKALADTDVGLIDVKTAAGDVAITQISIPLSSALGVRGSGTLSTTRARLRSGAGQVNAYHTITASKATAGGKVRLWLYYRRVRPNAAVG
jgi:hypothetical protein